MYGEISTALEQEIYRRILFSLHKPEKIILVQSTPQKARFDVDIKTCSKLSLIKQAKSSVPGDENKIGT